MNPDELQQKFFAAARALPPSDHVPYAFEKRIMSRLGSSPVLDAWAVWSRLLWRAAAPCVAITVVLSVWTAMSYHPASTSESLAADFERTVWAPLSPLGDSW